MMGKVFTPGPWFVSPHPNNWNELTIMSLKKDVFPGGIEVASLYGPDSEEYDCKANAALIAAAPEMYEALESLLEFAEASGDGLINKVEFKLAKTALLKAKGGL